MKVLTVISNYNEEEAISLTIEDIRKNASIDTDIVVIDNCSTDKSLSVIRTLDVDYIAHPVNTGGSAGVIKTALTYAYNEEYDVYCHMDGDNQHSAAHLDRLLAPIEEKKADIIIGSRFIEKEGFQSLFFRRIGIRLFSNLVSWLTSYEITDLTSGFRAYNRNAIEFFVRKHKHEIEPCVQMLLLASYGGLKLQEVPVTMKGRDTGVSEFNLYRSAAFPIKGLMSVVGALLQKN